MTALVPAVLFALILAASVYSVKRPGNGADRLNLCAAAIGLALLVVSIPLSIAAIQKSGSPELVSWGNDMMSFWWKILSIAGGIPALILLIGMGIAAAEKKYSGFGHWIRLAVATAAPGAVLLLAAWYGSVIAHDELPLTVYVLLSSCGAALLFRAFFPIESMLVRKKRPSAKDSQKGFPT